MLVLIVICSLLTLCYVLLMLAYRSGWTAQEAFVMPENFIPQTRISVIIPARNEAANIEACIRSVLRQEYPSGLFEIIVIDDHSTDDTAAIVNTFAAYNVRCIDLATRLNNNDELLAFKKKAIAIGISESKGDLIVTTDADCIVPKTWLKQIAAIQERSGAVMVVGPVAFTCNSSIVERFQVIDFMSMQGITAAAHKLGMGNMSNGANLAFSKAAYMQVGGYTGIDHLASGDDYLLMNKLQKAFPGRIAYLKSKNAIVSTPPQQDWPGFLQQRIRWASKSGKYDDKVITFILVFVYLFNLSFLVLLIAGIWLPLLLIVAALMLFIKIAVELYYLFPVARFFNEQRQLLYFPFLQPLHIVYIILAGLLGFAGTYEWKGRKVR